MAVFNFAPTVRVDTYNLTIDTFTPGDIGDYDFFSGSATALSFFDDASIITTLQGTGFQFATFLGRLVDVSGGTLNGILALVGGETLASVTGWSLNAADVFDLTGDLGGRPD